MDIYSVIETQVVAQMTPVITLTSIDVVSATSWKLWSCNTEWTTVGMDITIDGESYKVSSFVQDEYLIVTGTVTPVQLYFQLSAPHFEYGSHRKTNIERGTAKNKKLITPFVYMPLVENAGIKKEFDSPYGFEGNVRLFFLHEFDTKKPTRIIHKTNIINPMKAMADYAMYIIDQRQDIFDDVYGTKEIERMDFGDVAIWGNKERIFDENLSGAERSFELRVEENEITCGCCQTEFSPSCLPVNFLLNGVQSDVIQSGTDFPLTVVDTNLLPVGTYDTNTQTVTVPADDGGGVASQTFNGAAVVDQDSGTTKVITVKDSAAVNVGTKGTDTALALAISIADTNKSFQGNQITPIPAEQFIEVGVYDTAGNFIGTAITDTANILDVEISDSTVNITDSAATLLYAKTVKAQGTASQVITDSTVNITDSAAALLYAKTVKAQNTTAQIISDSTVNVKDSSGTLLYAKAVKAQASVDQTVTDSTVNVKDSAGNILYAKAVKAQATADQVVTDVTQTLNAVAITNNKAQTSKAITIRYANNDPVVVTTITDTEASFIGEVPDLSLTYDLYFDGVDTTQDVVVDGTNITINLT